MNLISIEIIISSIVLGIVLIINQFITKDRPRWEIDWFIYLCYITATVSYLIEKWC